MLSQGGAAENDSWVMINTDTEEGAADQHSLDFVVKNNSALGGTPITYTASDILAVNELVTATGLCDMPFRDVCAALIDGAEGGTLSKYAFDECVRKLVPGEFMDVDTRRRLPATLSGVFFAFDRDGAAAVDALELAAGFSIFCKGNKSDKLAFAFETMDDNMDGRLNRRATWR